MLPAEIYKLVGEFKEEKFALKGEMVGSVFKFWFTLFVMS